MKIYTKTGDEGKTSLFGGQRVSKDDLRIEAYGTTDELNAFIGQLISLIDNEGVTEVLFSFQNDIFVIGSMLSMPADKQYEIPKISENSILKIENEIDNMEANLTPLKNFILPSGNQQVSLSHVCRTVARRAERRIVTLERTEEIDPLIKKYVNRLSDYFFVLSRYLALESGVSEVIWKANE